MVEGVVELVADRTAIAVFANLVDDKYSTNYEADFHDPAATARSGWPTKPLSFGAAHDPR